MATAVRPPVAPGSPERREPPTEPSRGSAKRARRGAISGEGHGLSTGQKVTLGVGATTLLALGAGALYLETHQDSAHTSTTTTQQTPDATSTTTTEPPTATVEAIHAPTIAGLQLVQKGNEYVYMGTGQEVRLGNGIVLTFNSGEKVFDYAYNSSYTNAEGKPTGVLLITAEAAKQLYAADPSAYLTQVSAKYDAHIAFEASNFTHSGYDPSAITPAIKATTTDGSTFDLVNPALIGGDRIRSGVDPAGTFSGETNPAQNNCNTYTDITGGMCTTLATNHPDEFNQVYYYGGKSTGENSVPFGGRFATGVNTSYSTWGLFNSGYDGSKPVAGTLFEVAPRVATVDGMSILGFTAS